MNFEIAQAAYDNQSDPWLEQEDFSPTDLDYKKAVSRLKNGIPVKFESLTVDQDCITDALKEDSELQAQIITAYINKNMNAVRTILDEAFEAEVVSQFTEYFPEEGRPTNW